MSATPVLSSPPGNRKELLRRLEALVLPVVHGLGLQLWGMEYLPLGRKAMLRIYLEGEDGVTVDDCAMVSRQLGPALDVEEALPASFTLEVSSPGLERIFFRPEQLQAYLGSTVHALLKEPVEGRKTFRGELESVEGSLLKLNENRQTVSLQWDEIKKIHLVHAFGRDTTRPE